MFEFEIILIFNKRIKIEIYEKNIIVKYGGIMELKYISKNDGYILDRKFTNPDEMMNLDTYKEQGEMTISEVLPIDNEELEKTISEYAFDNMKENILKIIKKKYSVSTEEIYNFYFEGIVKKDESNKIYAKFQDAKIPVVPAEFNVFFEVEVKIKPKNFLKVQYNNLMYRINSI